ncbi:MAG: hypothetical protein NC904_06545 [Candidatus Omnitrophica bacterium]|nr:hypothetical protein [Candidatus Omnitrophota bacterium]
MVNLKKTFSMPINKEIKKLILLILAFTVVRDFLPSSIWSEVIDPNSYRHDYYMPTLQEDIQNRALLSMSLNSIIPRLTPVYPNIVVDAEGNKTIYFNGKPILSTSKDGTLTYFINGVKSYSEKLLDSGERYVFRVYRLHSHSLLEIQNEFGDTVGWEILGLDNRVVERLDGYGRKIYRLEYDGGNYWRYDVVNKIWTKLRYGLPVEERFGSKKGDIIAYWKEGTFFGETGLWRIEKGLDENGEIRDMYYNLYNKYATEDYLRYQDNGALVGRKDWSKGLRLEEKWGAQLDYYRYGDFGVNEEGDIYHDSLIERWAYEYNGSKLLRAKRFYPDIPYYDERIYDDNGNVIKILRKGINTDEELVLEEIIYFSDVENMSVEQLSDKFAISPKGAKDLLDWIRVMRDKGKASASIFGVLSSLNSPELSLYDEYNRQLFTICLYEY